MKRFLCCSLPLALTGLLLAAPASASENPALKGCAAKQHILQTQIDTARTEGNRNQLAGMEKALSEMQANCTDAGLRKEREATVAKHKAEVSEREAELAAAQAKGDAEKIAKRQAKLAEARLELQQALDALER